MDAVTLMRGTPESRGVRSQSIIELLEAFDTEKVELHSLMIARNGAVIAEGWWRPYASELKHVLYSLSKSFTSTAAGMLVDEQRLDLDAKVASFFPEYLPASPSELLLRMRVRDLLSMSTGHDQDTLLALVDQEAVPWPQAFLAQPVVHEPGTHFLYNSGATYMVSAIVQKITRETLISYLTPRLFLPLGIEDAEWEVCPQGVCTGGWGLSIKTEDILKFGLLYLNKGVWNGKRLLSSEWIKDATSIQISNGDGGENDWAQGYGFQFWRCRNNCFRGDGAFGQYCIIMPEENAVVAITAGQGDMQKVLNLIWQHLLPAFENSTIEADLAANIELSARLAEVTLRYERGAALPESPGLQHFGIHVTADNTAGIQHIEFACQSGAIWLTVRDRIGEFVLNIGTDASWLYGTTRLGAMALVSSHDRRYAATGGWTSPKQFEARVAFIETPYTATVKLTLEGDVCSFRYVQNVRFGGDDPSPVTGILETS